MRNNIGVSEYIKSYKKHKKTISEYKNFDKVKISILSSFTIQGMREVLFEKCFENRIHSEIYMADYNQYQQEILSKNSNLYEFESDIIVLNIDVKSIMGDLYFMPYSINDDERRSWVENQLKEMQSLVDHLCQNSSAKIIMHNFEVPFYSPLGIAERKRSFGYFKSIEALNQKLEDIYMDSNQVYIFDYNNFASRVGKNNLCNKKYYYLGDVRIDLNLIPDLCDNYLSYIKPLMSQVKKCIVLDLDNTLWGGVVGEDGIDGIKLGPLYEGKVFFEFQKYLLAMYQRGIILAINSKNNYEDAIEVLRKHPFMILREEHFASIKINWNDKATNIQEISQELNIGLDSIVFFDDDSLNCEIVRSTFPVVKVVNLPNDISTYVDIFQSIDEFNTFNITKEDADRGKMYVQQRNRREFEHNSVDIITYLEGLQMEVEIEELNTFNIKRIAQLTQKTNQFNVTTKRYQVENLEEMSSNGYHISCIKVRDKFGDNGIVGVAILKEEEAKWIIDSFILSCRVIGRNIEKVLLYYIESYARELGAKKLLGQFIYTSKNAPAKDFYKNNGFTIIERNNEYESWEFDVSEVRQYPEYIKVTVNNKE